MLRLMVILILALLPSVALAQGLEGDPWNDLDTQDQLMWQRMDQFEQQQRLDAIERRLQERELDDATRSAIDPEPSYSVSAPKFQFPRQYGR